MKQVEEFNGKVQALTSELSQWVSFFIAENPESGHLLSDLNLVLMDLATQSFKQMHLRKQKFRPLSSEELKNTFLSEVMEGYIKLWENTDIYPG